MNVVLIACSKSKDQTPEPMPAMRRYTGDLFKKSLAYARTLTHDTLIFVLSAKYYAISIFDHIEDYELTLNTMKVAERREWSEMVLNVLFYNIQKRALPVPMEFIILAGEKYAEFIEEPLMQYGPVHRPLKGLGIGQQLQWLKERTS